MICWKSLCKFLFISHFVSEINNRIKRKYSWTKKNEGINSMAKRAPPMDENQMATTIPTNSKKTGNNANAIK